MATVNLHPSSTLINDWDLAGSADTGTAHGNLSDSNDNSVLRENDQTRHCIFQLDNYTAGGTVTSIRWYVRATMFNTRSSSSNTAIQVTLGNGSHTNISTGTEYYDENVTVEFQAGYAQNDYYGTARADDGSSAWDATSLDALRLDINTSPADPPGISMIQVAKAYVEVTYTVAVGYGNNVLGIARANISKVNGIATADISKVNGV